MIALLANPNLSLPLLLLGLLLIYLDFNIPGKVVPAALGTFWICVAFYGLMHTPVLLSALFLIFFSIACILLDLARPTRNVLPFLGTVGLIYALFHLADVPNAPHRVHLLTAFCTATAFTAVTLWLGRIALLARRNKAVPARQTR